MRWDYARVDDGRLLLADRHFHDPLRQKDPVVFQPAVDLFHPDMPFDTVNDLLYIAQRAAQHEYRFLTWNPNRLLAYYSSDLIRCQLMMRGKHIRWGFSARTAATLMHCAANLTRTGLHDVWFDTSGARECLPLARVLPHDFSMDPQKPGYCEDCGSQKKAGRHASDSKPRVEWFTVSRGLFYDAMVAQIDRGGAKLLPEVG